MEQFSVLSRELLSLPLVVLFPMVQLHCEELNQGLASKARSFSLLLLHRLVTNHRQHNLRSVHSRAPQLA